MVDVCRSKQIAPYWKDKHSAEFEEMFCTDGKRLQRAFSEELNKYDDDVWKGVLFLTAKPMCVFYATMSGRSYLY